MTLQGGQINFLAGAGVPAGLIDEAIGLWNSGCPGNVGNDFPALVNGGSGGPTYTIVMGGHNSSDGDCGRFSGSTITLFTSSTEGGQRKDCGNLAMNLAHEFGHVLGLKDALGGNQCQFHIMSWINKDNLYSRAVQSEECSKVDGRWITPTEGGGGGGGGAGNPCV